MAYKRKARTKKRRLRGGTKKSNKKSNTYVLNNNNDNTITVHVQNNKGDVISKTYEPYAGYIGYLRLYLSTKKKTHFNTVRITTDDEKVALPDSEKLVNGAVYYVEYTPNTHPYTKIYSKHVDNREYEITMKMNKYGITPRVLQSFPLKNNNSNGLKWTIVMESWPMTWDKYSKTEKYHATRDILLERLLEKIDMAHRHGVYHDDLTTHKQNVVVDVDRLDVAIIDWGQSMYIDQIDEDMIKNIVNSEDLNHTRIRNVDDLVRYEYEYVKENY